MKGMETDKGKDKNPVIEIVEGGPINIKGRIVFKDLKRDITTDLDEVSLCLCGRSKNMPFCDDSHLSHFESIE